ncbi:hypothetical protein TNCV_1680011 [Trichonephila clavipes]|nr:hypothetical protein TNCV_1680011 [Trichonephila clavipes]
MWRFGKWGDSSQVSSSSFDHGSKSRGLLQVILELFRCLMETKKSKYEAKVSSYRERRAVCFLLLLGRTDYRSDPSQSASSIVEDFFPDQEDLEWSVVIVTSSRAPNTFPCHRTDCMLQRVTSLDPICSEFL